MSQQTPKFFTIYSPEPHQGSCCVGPRKVFVSCLKPDGFLYLRKSDIKRDLSDITHYIIIAFFDRSRAIEEYHMRIQNELPPIGSGLVSDYPLTNLKDVKILDDADLNTDDFDVVCHEDHQDHELCLRKICERMTTMS